MLSPAGVMGVYGALAIWAALLALGAMRGGWRPFLIFGVLFLLFLNAGYFINGAPSAIAFFISIYDVLDNFGVDPAVGAPALGACADNACSVWGDRYDLHPSWGVAFHERFTAGDGMRNGLLYSHIGFNSFAFVLMHVQLFRPGYGARKAGHGLIGKIVFAAVTLGTISAVWLASQHGDVASYGGSWSTWGFYSMAACVYACVVLGAVAARRGDAERHRIWMIRFIGAMWGAFWLFRVMLFVLGPLLREWDSAAILTCIWLSAPLGVAIAEYMRRRADAARSGAELGAPVGA
ncbi:MAG: DUF2306 domain-containing protein [Pseudomonadota bacterium]